MTQHGEKHSDQQNDKSLPNTGEDETNRGVLVSLVLIMLAGLGLIRRSKKDKNKDRKNNED
ncbi:LPXTG cell wall anchor domain-containing protein [Staphylococcus capitis]